MGLTLIEAAKLNPGEVIRNAIIEMYAGSSDVLRFLSFNDITGNAMKYNREGALPGVGFRGVNEAYTPSTGILNPMTESLVIAGGDLDVDKFIVDTMGMNQRSIHEAMKVRALGLAWTAKFIKGDTASDPREFDGLQVRVTGDQKIAAGDTANGTPLALAKLDAAIDQTLDPTHIVLSKAMARKFAAAARGGLGGDYVVTIDDMGRRVERYAGLPFITVDLDNAGGFDLDKLVGRPAMLNIVYSDDGKYANIKSINPLVQGMECPAQVNPSFIFSIDEVGTEKFETLSEKMKEYINQAEELKPKNNSVKTATAPDFDDDIPF